MKINWEVDDGYCGGMRTQTTDIPDSEIEMCEDKQELEYLIEEYVQEDFYSTIFWNYSNYEKDLEEAKFIAGIEED